MKCFTFGAGSAGQLFCGTAPEAQVTPLEVFLPAEELNSLPLLAAGGSHVIVVRGRRVIRPLN